MSKTSQYPRLVKEFVVDKENGVVVSGFDEDTPSPSYRQKVHLRGHFRSEEGDVSHRYVDKESTMTVGYPDYFGRGQHLAMFPTILVVMFDPTIYDPHGHHFENNED